MKRRELLSVSSVLVFVLCVCGVAAWAQKSAVVNIPFVFTVGTKELPAGKYSIQPNADTNRLILRNMDTNESLNVPVLTRISSRGESTPQLVFDKTETKNFLAEVYIPGMDGFHLTGAPGKHTHTKVEGK